MNTEGHVRPHCMTGDAVFLFSPETTEDLSRPREKSARPVPRFADPGPVHLSEVTTHGGFLSLRPVWNALLSESDANGIFLTWEWLTTWWEVFGRDKDLYILLGYTCTHELIGIAPLMVRNVAVFGVPLRSVEFIGSGDEVTPDQLAFIARPGYKTRFINAVFDHFAVRSSWDLMKFRDLKEDRELMRSARAFGRDGRRFNVVLNGICPYVTLPKDWEGFLETLSSQNRYNVGRKERAIAKTFSVGFSLVDDPQALPRAFGTLEALHKRRMQEKRLAGSSLGKEFWEFHRKVARMFLGNGWLFMGMLTVNGIVAACQYTFRYNNKACFYQSGIDPDFNRYSVGMLSTAYMIRESIRQGLVEYDFLRGAEEYKMHWTHAFRKNTEILIWKVSPRVLVPFVLFSAHKTLGRIKRRLMRSVREQVGHFRRKRALVLKLLTLPAFAALFAVPFLVRGPSGNARPPDVRGSWTWSISGRTGAERYVLRLEQDSGTVRGILRAGTDEVYLNGAKLAGNVLMFTVRRPVNGRQVETTFEGRIFGEAIEGYMMPGGESLTERSCWRATRQARASVGASSGFSRRSVTGKLSPEAQALR